MHERNGAYGGRGQIYARLRKYAVMTTGNNRRDAARRRDVHIFLGLYRTIPLQRSVLAALERAQKYDFLCKKMAHKRVSLLDNRHKEER